jgi:hypothetical protein
VICYGIVALREHRLTLLGRLVVGSIAPRKKAVEQLGDRVYEAPLVALAEPGTEHPIIEADIQKLASQLRFSNLLMIALTQNGMSDSSYTV